MCLEMFCAVKIKQKVGNQIYLFGRLDKNNEISLSFEYDWTPKMSKLCNTSGPKLANLEPPAPLDTPLSPFPVAVHSAYSCVFCSNTQVEDCVLFC